MALAFARFAGITWLRELIAARASRANHADHLGLGPIRRSTLAEANAKRPLALDQAVLSFLPDRLQPRRARSARAALRLVDANTIRLSALSEGARVGIHHHGSNRTSPTTRKPACRAFLGSARRQRLRLRHPAQDQCAARGAQDRPAKG